MEIIGKQEERVWIEFSAAKMAGMGLDSQTINDIVSQQNALEPGGRIWLGTQSIRVETSGEYKSIEEIGNTVIALPNNNNSFLLKDIVDIKREYEDPPQMQMRFMGKEAMGIVLQMQTGGQILELGENVKQRIEKFLEPAQFIRLQA